MGIEDFRNGLGYALKLVIKLESELNPRNMTFWLYLGRYKRLQGKK